MSAQLIARQIEKPDLTLSFSAKIIENINRADKMIQDLLDAQRLRAGKSLSFEIQPMNLGEVVRGSLEDLTTIHGDRFILKTEGDLDGYWSPAGVRRVVENLCTNAIKYGSPHGSVKICALAKDDRIKLTVHNIGEPLSVEDKSRLFEQFQRSTSAQMSGLKGWGIGLTIVRGVAEAHGGSVQVHSVSDGTEFVVTFPRDAAHFRRPTYEETSDRFINNGMCSSAFGGLSIFS
jgi:signal transduction histidine kinase